MRRGGITFLVLMFFCRLGAAEISIEPDRASGRYRPGDVATFTVRMTDNAGQPIQEGTLEVILSRDGGKVLDRRKFDLAKTPVPEISGTLNEPGFLRATVPGHLNSKNKTNCAGVAYDPEQICPGTAAPSDFNDFWKQEIAATEEIPLNPRIEKLPEFSTENFTCYSVSFAASGGRVFGFLTVPKAGHPVPAVVYVPGAGPGIDAPIRNQFGNQVAVLAMNVHDYDPRTPGKTLSALYAEANRSGWYCKRNSENRKTYFYHRAVLGINRAVNYLATRPDIDKKRIGVFGSSQGGMFALILAAINPHICAAVANAPAMCDHCAYLQGRQPGWPQLADPKKPETVETAGYYDVVNFCRYIQIPVRVIAGFADSTSTPGSIYAAFNLIPVLDKKIIGEVGMGHTSRDSYGTANFWLISYLTKQQKADLKNKIEKREE